MSEVNTIYLFVVVIFVGIFAGRAAEIYKFPRIIPLILSGLLITTLTYIFGLEVEVQGIRDMALIIAEIALIIVLYREGMHLDIQLILKNIIPILILAIITTFLTTIVVGLSVIFIHILTVNILSALLIGAIVAPTDPAATFSILRGGGTRIKEDIEVTLGGESALNDIIAILFVVVIIVPQLQSGYTEIIVSLDFILVGLWTIIGGILLGLIIGAVSILFISFTGNKSEISFISLGGMFVIFVFSTPLGTSSAIAALICGIVIRNPNYIGMKIYFNRTHLYEFWDDITFLAEILAFSFIGFLLKIDAIFAFITIGVIISIIVIISRIISVFVTTLPFEVYSKTASFFSNHERIFIGLAGFKGLTTGILAAYSFVHLESVNLELAELILYSCILVILISGTFQGLILKPLSRKTNVIEELTEVDELLARKLVIETELTKLIDDRAQNKVQGSVFRRLSIPLKEELYLIEERYQTLIAQEKVQKEFLEYQLYLLEDAIKALNSAYEDNKISHLAFSRVNRKYQDQLLDVRKRYEEVMKISTSVPKPESPITVVKAKEVDLLLIQESVDKISKDQKLLKRFPELSQVHNLLKRVKGRLETREKYEPKLDDEPK